MKAIVQKAYGGAGVLGLDDVPQPTAAAGQVLVQVVAAGVDRGALHFMTGHPYLMRLGTGLRSPKVVVPGVSFAGRVEAVGSDVTTFEPGDEVYGAARGTYAELVAASAAKIAPKPVRLSFEEAAVLPYASFAALQAVRDHARVKSGEQVLVVGATGAVGSIALQLAKAYGAEVTAVCGARGQEVAKSLGADHVIDYRRQDFADGTHHYDVILDVFGRSSLKQLRRALTPHGRLVIVGGEGDRWIGGIHRQLGATVLSPFVGQTLRTFVAKENTETLLAMNAFIEAGQVTPLIDRSYPLTDAPSAVAELETGSPSGRLVITV
jgi:NADPH:quinone reductase-like Zn-dependent oxidoreductase